MTENTAHGLDLLDPDQEVVVTGEEEHQDVLRAWAPVAGPCRVAVELRPAPLRRGRHAGQPGLEALLDGRRIGELTQLMSVRYRPHVDEVLRRGGRPGAVGLVRHGRRGLVEVELRLPDVDAAPTAPLPPDPWPVPAPVPRPAGRRRLRTPLLVGGGVLVLLIGVGAATGGGGGGEPAAPALAAPVASTTPPPTTTPAAPTTPSPAPTVDDDERAPARTVPTSRAPARTSETTRPAPRPDPEPEPEPAPVRPARSDCHPSYEPCLPDGPDLDCGDVDGSVTVVGPDDYRLDNDGDGTGCDSN